MGLLQVCRKAGTLVCGIRDVWLSALLKVVKLPEDVSVVKAAIMWQCIIMATEQLAGSCQSGLDLGIVSLEVKLLKDAVNQMGLCEVDSSSWWHWIFTPRKSDMSPSYCEIQPYPLHVLDDLVQFLKVWSCQD